MSNSNLNKNSNSKFRKSYSINKGSFKSSKIDDNEFNAQIDNQNKIYNSNQISCSLECDCSLHKGRQLRLKRPNNIKNSSTSSFIDSSKNTNQPTLEILSTIDINQIDNLAIENISISKNHINDNISINSNVMNITKEFKIKFIYSKKSRINSSAVFVSLLKQRPSIKNDVFSMHISKSETGKTRLGLIVSKKLCKKSCNRNKIKRMIREAFRLNAPYIDGLDILCRLKFDTNKSKNTSFKQYTKSINDLFASVIKYQNK